MIQKKTRALILAAGKGSRMHSLVPKVLHKILNKTIIEYVVESLEQDYIERIGIVVSIHNLDQIRKVLNNRVDYIVQDPPLGTGHAVIESFHWLSMFKGSLIVVVGDAPFINKNIISRIVEKQQRANSAVCFLTTITDNPPPWGRVIRDSSNNVISIVEENDATTDEKKIKEISSSHYCFDWKSLRIALGQIENKNIQKEYYLPDVINQFVKKEKLVETETIHNILTSFGINTPEDLIFAEEQMELIGHNNG